MVARFTVVKRPVPTGWAGGARGGGVRGAAAEAVAGRRDDPRRGAGRHRRAGSVDDGRPRRAARRERVVDLPPREWPAGDRGDAAGAAGRPPRDPVARQVRPGRPGGLLDALLPAAAARAAEIEDPLEGADEARRRGPVLV